LGTLIDTGANLSFISNSLSDKLEKDSLGVRGIGNYKVTDAFLKAYYFKDNLTFRIRLNTGNPDIDSKSWLITAVIVDIDFTADFLLGLSDIKRIKLFRYLPECVENSEVVEESDQKEKDETFGETTNRANLATLPEPLSEYPEIQGKIESGTIRYSECHKDVRTESEIEINERRNGIWGEEWSKEERIRRGKEAYEREEIEEVDYNLVEAIPPEALEEEPEVKLPEKIFGPETLRQSIRRLLERFVRVFSRKLRKEAAKVSALKIEVDKKLWEIKKNQFNPRELGGKRDAELERIVRKLLEAECIRRSRSSFYSFAFLVPKPNGDWRLVLNFKGLNKATTNVDRWPIPYIGRLLRRIGSLKPRYFAVMDLTSGFFQVSIDGASSPFTAFITQSGIYEWVRIPMRITSAPSHFQRVIATEVLIGLIGIICMLYIDDIIIFGDTEEAFIENLMHVLMRLEKHGITVNPDKCSFGLEEIEYVGHTISANGIHFTRSKLDSVMNFQKPVTQKGMKGFIGLVNYFREHVSNSSIITAPLEEMVKPYNPKSKLQWTPERESKYDEVKLAVHECPALWFVDENQKIFVKTDSSDYGIGGYMYQIIDGAEKPIAFISKAYDKPMLKCIHERGLRNLLRSEEMEAPVTR